MSVKIKSIYQNIDTPALLLDETILLKNIAFMQNKADEMGVSLRPHTKTSKMPYIAAMQKQAGACGITVAKVGEAEEMAKYGLDNIFIANQIIGESKVERIKVLSEKIYVTAGLDSMFSIHQIEKVFSAGKTKANIMIEIETGENRSGVVSEKLYLSLLTEIKNCKHINFCGIYTHEGFTYKSLSKEACLKSFEEVQTRLLHFASVAADNNLPCKTVSIGATPTALFCSFIKKGITEIRPGTYVFMDAGQGNAIGTYENCAATVLTTVISKPTDERIVCDVGAKGLTMQNRTEGICKTTGLGIIKNSTTHIASVYDEHALIYDKELHKILDIGDKIEIIPNHICPVSNLYHTAFLVKDGKILKTIDISCQGKMQ